MNSLNIHYNPLFDSKRQSTFGVTVKSTMYFRKPYSVPSVLSRRRWSRRKHLYGWLPLSNVIKTWAQTYRFHKNYLKAITRAHFTRSSFLAFNLISLKNTVPSKYKGSELIISSSLPKKILRYFSAFSNPRLQSLLSFRNINLSFNSILPSIVTEEPFLTPYTVMFVHDDVKAFSTPSVEPQSAPGVSLHLLNKLFFQIFHLSLVPIKFFYRLLILLVIARKL